MNKHILFVCRACSFSQTERKYLGQSGGLHLLDRLSTIYQDWALQPDFLLQEAGCLSACNRPCAIAFAAPHKTTLMFGDLSPLHSAPAILEFGEQYYHSTDGLVPRPERPELLQKGILARIPPMTNYANSQS